MWRCAAVVLALLVVAEVSNSVVGNKLGTSRH
jgi:hypothetical protein